MHVNSESIIPNSGVINHSRWTWYGVGILGGILLTSTLAILPADAQSLNNDLIQWCSSTDFFANGAREESDEEEVNENQVNALVEELFLGSIVYPQEEDEIQLTFGHFENIETLNTTQTVFEIEYGITDRLQIGMEVPFDSVEEDEPFEGVRAIALDLYYNFYADRRSGRAYGVGMELGLPVDSADGESRAYVYEPYAIAYQEFRKFAVNVSAGLEIENPWESEEETETEGEVAVGLIGKAERIVPLFEFQVEIASDETPVLLAPGLYFIRLLGPIDGAISLPVGLNDDAPEIAVFFLAILEFDAAILRPAYLR